MKKNNNSKMEIVSSSKFAASLQTVSRTDSPKPFSIRLLGSAIRNDAQILFSKKFIAFCFSLFAFFSLNAQNQNPVSWMATYKSVSANEGEIIISAKIEKNWHTYSQRETDAGPIPTSFSFEPSGNYELIGKVEESDAHEEFVKAFEANIFVFTDKAEFKQKIKLKGKAGFNIPFKVEYMTCNDMMCLPPKTVDLSVKVQ